MDTVAETLRTPHPVEALTALTEEDLANLAEILPPTFNSIAATDLAEFIPLAIEAESADVLVSRSPEDKLVSVMLVNVNYGAGKLRGHIDDVATHEDYRQQGYAGAVLDFAIAWFQARGVRRVFLTSSDERQPAHALYRSRGFIIHDTNNFQLDLH